jgi:hypothetical protein
LIQSGNFSSSAHRATHRGAQTSGAGDGAGGSRKHNRYELLNMDDITYITRAKSCGLRVEDGERQLQPSWWITSKSI